MAGNIASQYQESRMSGFTYNVVERVAELNAEEVVQVLGWVNGIREEVVRQMATYDAGTDTHLTCEQNLADLDALLVALRARA